MSDHTLPDDLSDWPKNPAEILGVERGADARALRKAYTRLLRLYKPEREPEKFQRIRAAYEVLLKMAELGASFELPVGIPLEHTDEPDAPEPVPFQSPEQKSEIDLAWDIACRGEITEAFQALRRLHQRGQDAETLFLRLYWLTRLHPDLEGGKPPCRWLTRGIKRHGLTDRLAQTYCAEVLLDPAEAVSLRCAGMLVIPGGLHYRFALLHARWEAAARAGNWKLIQTDLNQQRFRLMDEPAGTWPRLLLAAYTYAAWIDDEAAVRFAGSIRGNLQKSEEIDPSLDGEFLRFELLCEIIETLPRGSGYACSHLVELVREGWIADLERIRVLFQKQAAKWVQNVEDALSELGLLVGTSPASAVFLAQMASAMGHSAVRRDESDEETQRQRISEHLAVRLTAAAERRPKARLDLVRARLRAEAVRTCFDEVLGFDEAFEGDDHNWMPPELNVALTNDLPFRCLIEFGRVLYASS